MTTSPQSMKTLLLASLAVAAFGLGAQAQTALINPTLLNGSFETALLPVGGKSQNGFDTPAFDVTNWTNTNTDAAGATVGYGDAGYESGAAQNGAQFAFFHGGDGGAFNLTTAVINTGDVFNLSFYGNNGAGLTARLFSSTNGTYATNATLATSAITTAAGAYTQYFLAYTATPADSGKTVGVSFFGTAGYPNVDNVVLTVTPVPEPSTYALMFAGLGGLLLVTRARRSIA